MATMMATTVKPAGSISLQVTQSCPNSRWRSPKSEHSIKSISQNANSISSSSSSSSSSSFFTTARVSFKNNTHFFSKLFISTSNSKLKRSPVPKLTFHLNSNLTSNSSLNSNLTSKLNCERAVTSNSTSLDPTFESVVLSPENDKNGLWKFQDLCDFRTVSMVASILLASMLLPDSGLASVGEVVELGSAVGDYSEFQSGFASAFLLIFFSEIGDKTFFIAAILATRKSNLLVFTGTFGALVAMTLISVGLGRVFHVVDEAFPVTLGSSDLPLDDIAAVVLLVYFGVSTLIDARGEEAASSALEEQQEAELAVASVESRAELSSSYLATISAVFALVFVAEWGDKSFFSTIALAAASSPWGVVAGAAAGHAAATALAVLGGAFLGSYVSEKVVAYIGGSLFLVFALITSVEIWNKLT